MPDQHEASLIKFLIKYGRYYQPARYFYHRQLGQRLREMGFRVRSIDRLETHSVWRVRLKQTDSCLDFLRPYRLLEPKLKVQIRCALKDLGHGIPAAEIVVAGYGVYFQIAFVWPLGSAGTWQPPSDHPNPFDVSLMFRGWLREKRN